MPAVNENESIKIEINNDGDEDLVKEKMKNGTKIETKKPRMRKEKDKVPLNKSNSFEGIILKQLVNNERKIILKTLSHNIMPGFNLSVSESETRLKNLKNLPLFQCSIPNSVYVSCEHPNKIDLCHKRTIAHYDYMYLLKRQRAFYESAEKKRDYKKSMKKGVYPYTVINYAELLENNPDPYFEARYDWYYTGGNLKCFLENNLICHTTGSNLNQLVLSRLKKKSKTHHFKSIISKDFLTLNEYPNSEIFEIQSVSLKNRFSVRQKYSLSFITYDENDLIYDYIINSKETPIITSAGDLYSEIIATGNLNKEVFLWDLKNSTKIPKQTLLAKNIDSTNKSKNWNSLCNLNNNIFAFTTLNEFCLLDIRQSKNELKTNLCKFGKYKEICDDISSLTKSNYDNLIYFGTIHKLFTVDTRFMGKEITDKYIVQRWTHQMESAPLILKTYKFEENYELIALSSLLSGDIRICENICKFKKKKSIYNSSCLPFMPPSLQDGYKVAKINGECLDPITNLEKRIRSCTTGLDFVKKGDKLYLMHSNSLGDVFSTFLNFDEDIKYTDFNNKEIIMSYDNKIKINLEKNPLPLNLTDIVQLHGMSKVFRCERLNIDSYNNNNNNNISVINNDDLQRPKRKPKWQKSLSELCAYKDVLASNLLAVWDMELNENIMDNLPVIDNKIKKQNDIVKVNEWLNDSIMPVDDDLIEIVNSVNFNTVIHSAFIPSTTPENINRNILLEDSSIIDNTLRESDQVRNPEEKIVVDINLSKQSIKSGNVSEVPPGQLPQYQEFVINAKPKRGVKRKNTYKIGF